MWSFPGANVTLVGTIAAKLNTSLPWILFSSYPLQANSSWSSSEPLLICLFHGGHHWWPSVWASCWVICTTPSKSTLSSPHLKSQIPVFRPACKVDPVYFRLGNFREDSAFTTFNIMSILWLAKDDTELKFSPIVFNWSILSFVLFFFLESCRSDVKA